jgi:hypothetical protein
MVDIHGIGELDLGVPWLEGATAARILLTQGERISMPNTVYPEHTPIFNALGGGGWVSVAARTN